MRASAPSLTALSAASHRAVHQQDEGGRIFPDPLAVRILGGAMPQLSPEERLAQRPMRLFLAVRARLAEEMLADAAARGTRQLVILGAGLDTTAYRLAPARDMAVFEVDHPATGAWKRECLAQAGIAVPGATRLVAVDFERDNLSDCLAASGFDPSRPSALFWLGVVPYLTDAAIFATLAEIAAWPGGADIVFDYANPPDDLPEDVRAAHAARALRVAALGEPWITYYATPGLHARLRQTGFTVVRDWGHADIANRFFPGAASRAHGGHVLIARQ